MNQTSPAMAMTSAEIEKAAGIQPAYVFPAMPNACYAAVTLGTPIVDLAAQLSAAQAFTAFAGAIAERPGSIERSPVAQAAGSTAARPLATG